MGHGPIIGNEYASDVLRRVERRIVSTEYELKALKEKRDSLEKSIRAHDEREF